jgi:hypothetical protein
MATSSAEPSLPVEAPTAVPRLPPSRRLRPAERARLAVEIAAAYVRARRELRRAPIAAAVAALRGGAPAPGEHPAARTEPSPTRTEPTPAQAEHPSAHTGRDTVAEAQRLGRAVILTLRLLPGDTRCLARSLVLTALLARRGVAAKLVIGTRPDPDFRAHAWVECAGQAVLPPGDGSYGRLVEL